MQFVTWGFILTFYVHYSHCRLWPNGIVHYSINQKDYDVHSQDVITSNLRKIEKEICLKFFQTPLNYTATVDKKLLYISNSNRSKDCPNTEYDYTGNVVTLVIGYKCINSLDITRLITNMLRASIDPEGYLPASHEVKVKANDQIKSNYTVMMSPEDRNYINEKYFNVCNNLVQHVKSRRQMLSPQATLDSTTNFYEDKVWPLGVVMFGIDEDLQNTSDVALLHEAMRAVEEQNCVVFQQIDSDDQVLSAKNLLWFGNNGQDEPQFGFTPGKQEIKLSAMVHGAQGHVSHSINLLMRALGVPMMSNRYDRDNYVSVQWKHVVPGKEYQLEKMDKEAWFVDIPYDFNSVTHAPVNFLCNDCKPGEQTVTPRQDYLWQRALGMGHSVKFSNWDKETLNRIYSRNCQKRNG